MPQRVPGHSAPPPWVAEIGGGAHVFVARRNLRETGWSFHPAYVQRQGGLSMRKISILLLLTAFVFGGAAALALGEQSSHRFYRPDEIAWKDGPSSLPPGAKSALLDGDPSKDKPFAMRLKFPDRFRIMSHWHPKTERVTVISGTLNLGFGEKFDEHATHELPAGTFGYWTAGVRHFAWMKGETVLQLNSVGPWQLNYVNPADDPRKK